MKYSPLDLALQQAVPVVPVPLHGTFEPLENAGHRFLVGADGLHLEVKRDWIHAIWPVALDTRVAKPFGKIDHKVSLAFGAVPSWVKDRFAREAAEAGNVEIAAWVVWNSELGTLDYRRCDAIQASAANIKLVRPVLAVHESLVVDLHSHGFGRAFFSATDNIDDKNEVKIAGVVGNVNGRPQWEFRLCLAGVFVNETSKMAVNCESVEHEATHA